MNRPRTNKSIVFVGVLAGIGLLLPRFWDTSVAQSAREEEASSVRMNPTVRAVENTLPSVVNIATEKLVFRESPYETLYREFFDPYYRTQPEPVYSVGSGMFIDETGYLLSNGHVVREADRVWVKNAATGEEAEAKLIFEMPGVDLALLKADPAEITVTPISFASPDDLLMGEDVLALGNPYRLGGSVSKGILSSKNRRAFPSNNWLEPADWLQTDAAINPGNSGGPLINLDGDMIGVNVAMHGEAQNIGFAIPILRVFEALSLMFTPEAIAGNWFGVIADPASEPPLVVSVAKDSPAAAGGLRSGDEILSVDGVAVKNLFDLNRRLLRAEAGDRVNLAVRSNGRVENRRVRLLGPDSKALANYVQSWLGANIVPVDEEIATRYGLSRPRGFMVVSVAPNGFAARNRLQERMVLETVNRVELSTAAHLAQQLHLVEDAQSVEIEIKFPRLVGRRIAQWDTATIDARLR